MIRQSLPNPITLVASIRAQQIMLQSYELYKEPLLPSSPPFSLLIQHNGTPGPPFGITCLKPFQFILNLFTAPACKMSGLKSAHKHSCKQYIWWSRYKSALNTVHFDRSPLAFTCSFKGGKSHNDFQFQWHLYWSFSERWFSKHGSERVKY